MARGASGAVRGITLRLVSGESLAAELMIGKQERRMVQPYDLWMLLSIIVNARNTSVVSSLLQAILAAR